MIQQGNVVNVTTLTLQKKAIAFLKQFDHDMDYHEWFYFFILAHEEFQITRERMYEYEMVNYSKYIMKDDEWIIVDRFSEN